MDVRQIPLLRDTLLDYYTGKSQKERELLVYAMMSNWPAFETKMLSLSKDLSVRQAFLVAEEVLVQELRDLYRDLDSRRHFTPEDESIEDARSRYQELVDPDAITSEKASAAIAEMVMAGEGEFLG